MTVTVERPPTVGDALAAVGSLLADAADRPLWSVDDGELASLVVEAGAVVGRAQAVLLGLVGEADARGALLGDGAPSSQVWLRGRLRVSPSEAASYVQTARGLRAGLDVTAAACAAGTIGVRHAAVITRTVGELPPVPALRRDAERELVAHARVFDPTVLARLGRRLLAVADPDARRRPGRGRAGAGGGAGRPADGVHSDPGWGGRVVATRPARPGRRR